MKLDKTKISPSGTGVIGSNSIISMQQINNLLKSSKNNSSSSSQNEFNSSSVHRSPSIREVKCPFFKNKYSSWNMFWFLRNPI